MGWTGRETYGDTRGETTTQGERSTPKGDDYPRGEVDPEGGDYTRGEVEPEGGDYPRGEVDPEER